MTGPLDHEMRKSLENEMPAEVKNVPEPIRPQDDIGPFYKVLGAVCLLAGIGLAFYHEYHEKMFSWIDAGIVLILVVASIALIRPDKFDAVVKTIADRLPFFKYEKTPDA